MNDLDLNEVGLKEELLILGNGFDVKRKLKTTYADFMASQEIEQENNLWIDILKAAHVKDAWYDVEGTIKSVLLDLNPYILEYISYLVIKAKPEAIIKLDLVTEQELDELIGTLDDYATDFGGALKKYATKLDIFADQTINFVIDVANYVNDNFPDRARYIAMNSLSFFVFEDKGFKVKPASTPYNMDISYHVESFILDREIHGDVEFDELLKEELHAFESLFTDYLVSQNTTSQKAVSRSQTLLSKILEKREGKKLIY